MSVQIAPPLRITRPIEIDWPSRVTPTDLLRTVGEVLEQHGNTVRFIGGGMLVFDGLRPFRRLPPGVDRGAWLVEGGVARVDAAGPVPRIRLELRYRPGAVFILPALAALVLAILPVPPAVRLVFLLMVVAPVILDCVMARRTYARLVRGAARRLGPP